MKKLSILFIIVHCILEFSLQLHAQEIDYHYLHFTQKDGLPSNTVYSVTQDKDGYLWIGTDAGVSKFDGINFKTYNIDDGLPSNEVFQVFCDSKNRIWLSTMSNEVVYIFRDKLVSKDIDSNLNKLKFTSSYFHFEELEDSTLVICNPSGISYLLKNNPIKVNSNDKEVISKITSLKNIKFKFTHLGIINLKTNILASFKNRKVVVYRDIIKLNDSTLLTLTHQNTLILDTLKNGNFKINQTSNSLKQFLFKSENSNDYVWLRKTLGFQMLNVINKRVEKSILLNYQCSSIYENKLKEKFISTLDNGIFISYSLNGICYKINNLSSNNNFASILKINNNLYAGNINNQVLEIKNIANNKTPKNLINISNLNTNRILSIDTFNNHLVFGSDQGFFKFNLKSHKIELFSDSITVKKICKHNNYLFILGYKKITILNPNFTIKQIIKTNLRNYSLVNYNQIILGSENGLHTFDFHSIKDYPLNLPIKTRFTDLKVYKNRLYASTIDKGVFLINGHNLVRNYNVTTGLSSNTCNKLQIYKNKLFVATKKGISVINLKNDTYQYIFESDGLASNTVNDFVIDHDTLIAATEKGISFISLNTLREQPKPIYFVNPIIVNNDTLWDATHVTYQNKHTLILNLNSISFNTEAKIVHYYRIKGYDTNWHSTIDHQLRINYLTPGNYIIESFAVNSYNTRSAIKSLSIYVSPYFYQTLPFHLLMVALLIFLFYYFNQFRERIIKETEKIRQELLMQSSALELSVWRSKINPHFVFNSLNTVQSLYQASEFEQANQYMSNFSQIIRKTIDSSNNLFLTLQEEIDYHTKYLELEKIKRKGSFSFTINYSSEKLLKMLIPTMTLQPILENSLKHGIQNKNPGILNINFMLHENFYTCEITDNGCGIQGEIQPTSHGLSLVKQKIEIIKKLTSQEIKFEYHNNFDKKNGIIGFKTIFTFPFFNPLNDLNEGHNN